MENLAPLRVAPKRKLGVWTLGGATFDVVDEPAGADCRGNLEVVGGGVDNARDGHGGDGPFEGGLH